MWDVAACLTLTHMVAWGGRTVWCETGLPFLITVLAAAWHGGLLPSEVYSYGNVRPEHVMALTVLVDVQQCLVHIASHAIPALRRSHGIHHQSKRPTPRDAFCTGWIDAFTQLMLPLYASITLVRPNRSTAIVFGLIYSHWLVYLHSALPDHPIAGLVTPSYHKHHHAVPSEHFSHVFAWY